MRAHDRSDPEPPVQRVRRTLAGQTPPGSSQRSDATLIRRLEDRADRRDAEREIHRRLVEIDFDPESLLSRGLADRLTRYGLVVLVAWGLKRVLRSKAYARKVAGYSRIPEDLELDKYEAESLVQEVLVVSLEKFWRISLRSWNPDGGASLHTWFIWRCLWDLPDVFERWDRNERRPLPEDSRADDGRHGHRPDEEAEARVLLEEALATVSDPMVRPVLELQDQGYTQREIAQTLGTTENVVRTRRHTATKRIRKEVEK